MSKLHEYSRTLIHSSEGCLIYLLDYGLTKYEDNINSNYYSNEEEYSEDDGGRSEALSFHYQSFSNIGEICEF